MTPVAEGSVADIADAVLLERMAGALREIIRHNAHPGGCGSFTSGDCARAGKTYGAEFGADRWCDVCVARAGLAGYPEVPPAPEKAPPTLTVADLPDSELLGRSVRGAVLDARGRPAPRWVCVMARFGLGSTYAGQLVRRFGLDPEETVKRGRR